MSSVQLETPRRSPPTTRTLRVHRLEKVTPQVLLVELRDPESELLPPAEPGAHIDVHLPDGAVRSYSLCGDPADRHAYSIAVLNVQGGRGSRFIHGDLEPGTDITVALPRNNFRFDEAPRYLFIAGGIGITPLLPMIREAAHRKAAWALHYCVRSAAAAPFLPELRALAGSKGANGRVEVHAADEGRKLTVDALLAETPDDVLVYCCGPQRLMETVAAAARPTQDVRFEWFAPRTEPVREDASDDSFEVVCARSGVTVTVAAGTSILEALDGAGVAVDSSCEQGICGTCETAVLEGEPDHRDSVLSDAERAAGKTMMLCVSRARSARLVLDV
ncbi:PDR/VanB family oxidoreductase [Azospirillum sp.]|uniref:PDR/VanB family oxidoreductase n=1 Tax=Azospirillum sp. TaxID=34012 RepID=UPI002D6ACD59|nr:PDR/VanB family oxidoreductase [Azospirillum sp.]HYF88696.1 PDR/VanB family oxidoreductase [Azospirillum sp.]